MCVDGVVRLGMHGALERVQILFKLRDYEVSFFLSFSVNESSLTQSFCESCVHFGFTHSSVHINRRFVIQGCPTLSTISDN